MCPKMSSEANRKAWIVRRVSWKCDLILNRVEMGRGKYLQRWEKLSPEKFSHVIYSARLVIIEGTFCRLWTVQLNAGSQTGL
jgi:hypothetical protein